MSDPSPRIPGSSRLRQLISALCDETISPAEREELEQALLLDASARLQFLEAMSVDAGLIWETAAREKLAGLWTSCPTTDHDAAIRLMSEVDRSGSPRTWGARRRMILITAATAAALATLIIQPWKLGRIDDERPQELAQRENHDPIAESVVAELSPASADCRWIFERGCDPFASVASAGDTLRITDGNLKLHFASGAEVTLTAPALIDIVSPMRGRVLRGRATVNVPTGAEGFTIDTSGTSVIDRGTMFGVEVDDVGRTDVIVFKGIVDMDYPRPDDDESGEVNPRRLYMGEGVRVDERGTVSRIVWLNSDRFAARSDDPPTPPSRPPVISAVDDNITRADSDRWKFYEIVPEGMREDALAFVDRAGHEWNGVDERGIPKYLLGGDYVKTFNNDKFSEIEVFVTLERPANLYVLFDNRGIPPQWLREEFEPTGDDIGVDEATHVFKDGKVFQADGPRVGPGESIETRHSIWRRKVTKAGKVHLGSTGATDGDFNMYGIVAVPLP